MRSTEREKQISWDLNPTESTNIVIHVIIVVFQEYITVQGLGKQKRESINYYSDILKQKFYLMMAIISSQYYVGN